MNEFGGRVLQGFAPEAALIGARNPGYQKIAHLREEALEKSLLLRCRAIGLVPE